MEILDFASKYWSVLSGFVLFIVWLVRLEMKLKYNTTRIEEVEKISCSKEKEFKQELKQMEESFMKTTDILHGAIDDLKNMTTDLKTIVARLDERTHKA